jgi:polygalacturonase
MIYANGAENIGLTGSGKLFAQRKDCELLKYALGAVKEELQKVPFEQRIFDGSNGGKICVPQFFGPINCKNILVEGVKFIDSIFWNIVPVYCENIIIRNVEVNSYGYGRTDGIDIDSSKNALIENVTLDCGDDAFTLKAGRGMDGKLKGIPTENVVIRNCTVKRSVGGVTVGSETAAMIRNVYMHDCIMENPNSGFYFKSRRPRGGGGENMWFERIHIIETPGTAFKWDMLGSSTYVGEMAKRHPAPPVTELTPVFRQMYFKDIIVDNCKTLIKAEGLPESPIEDITFENLQSKNHEIVLQDVGKMSFI